MRRSPRRDERSEDMNRDTHEQQRQEGARHLVFLAEELARNIAVTGCLANWKNTRRGWLPKSEVHTLRISTPVSSVEVQLTDEEVTGYPHAPTKDATLLKIKAAMTALR